MRINCRVCNQLIESQETNPEKGVLAEMAEHMKQHPQEAQELASALVTTTKLVGTYLLLKHYVTMPADETELRARFRENEKVLRTIFTTPVVAISPRPAVTSRK